MNPNTPQNPQTCPSDVDGLVRFLNALPGLKNKEARYQAYCQKTPFEAREAARRAAGIAFWDLPFQVKSSVLGQTIWIVPAGWDAMDFENPWMHAEVKHIHDIQAEDDEDLGDILRKLYATKQVFDGQVLA